jgi:hypothetical protein
LFNDIAQVAHEGLSVGRELLGGRGEGLGAQGTVQGDIALLVLWGMVSTKRSWGAGGGARRTDGSLLFLKAK